MTQMKELPRGNRIIISVVGPDRVGIIAGVTNVLAANNINILDISQSMIRAVEEGALSLDKLEAMTCVCSVGLDMIAVPGDTPVETIAAIIADEAAIGVINQKTTAVRIIPAPGKIVGDYVEYGGLLGRAPVMAVNPFSAADFVRRGGRIPAPIHSLSN